jgi:hypothetical protein
LSEDRSIGRRQVGSGAVAAQGDGIAERSDEDFTIRTGAKMVAKLPADLRGKLVVDVGGELPENIETMSRWMGMTISRVAAFRR